MYNILIVDDSKSMAQVLKASLKKLACDDIFVCRTLEETKCLLEKNTDFFVAILDLNLPDAPFGEVVDYVQSKGIPSIVLTQNANEETRSKILSKSVIDYIVKCNMHEINYVTSLISRIMKNPFIKILVVDDSVSQRLYISNLLKIHKYQVIEAQDGIEAMDLLNQYGKEIMLVLTDYYMPNMDGLELIYAIRNTYTQSEICIIGMSSQATSKLSANLLKAGANDTITKPFLIEEFYSRVNNSINMLEYIQLIKNMSVKDQLTDLYNRRYLFDTGKKLFASSKENNKALAIAILDVDFFKRVNDSYGHEIGDHVLKSLANILIKSIPKHGIVARMGGEEFCVMIKGSANPDIFFEMLRRSIESMAIELNENTVLKVTASIGFVSSLEVTFDETLHMADNALYQAKKEGRNCVVRENILLKKALPVQSRH